MTVENDCWRGYETIVVPLGESASKSATGPHDPARSLTADNFFVHALWCRGYDVHNPDFGPYAYCLVRQPHAQHACAVMEQACDNACIDAAARMHTSMMTPQGEQVVQLRISLKDPKALECIDGMMQRRACHFPPAVGAGQEAQHLEHKRLHAYLRSLVLSKVAPNYLLTQREKEALEGLKSINPIAIAERDISMQTPQMESSRKVRALVLVVTQDQAKAVRNFLTTLKIPCHTRREKNAQLVILEPAAIALMKEMMLDMLPNFIVLGGDGVSRGL